MTASILSRTTSKPTPDDRFPAGDRLRGATMADVEVLMNEDALIECVNSMLAEFSHESTPLVRNIAKGAATREQITRLGVYFAYFTNVSPNELGYMIGRCEDRDARRGLL